jgi:replicative DNA helicase
VNAAKRTKPIAAVDVTEFEDPFIMGCVPPSVLDSEGVFLSALLLQPEKFADLAPLLRSEHFYSTANAHVFRAIAEVNDEHGTHDVVLVANHLRSTGLLKTIGGSPYLATLCDAQPATLNPGQHAAAIKEAWKRRTLFAVLARCATLLRNGEASHEDCYGELREHFREMKNA